MKSKQAKRLKIGAFIKRRVDRVDPTLVIRGEVIDRTTRSISIKWEEKDRPWEVLYFNDAFTMEPLDLDLLRHREA